jgi:hypothetical protein
VSTFIHAHQSREQCQRLNAGKKLRIDRRWTDELPETPAVQ